MSPQGRSVISITSMSGVRPNAIADRYSFGG
jgi:hypothetical protein